MPEMTPLEQCLTKEVEALRQENLRIVHENKILREKIDSLVRRVFGASSESIDLSRQDMSRWVGLAAEWLKPIYQIILGGMWGDGYAQVDEPSGAR